MPPRHAYWTILVDEQPTAFRAADRDDLQPTFKRLQEKHPSARMVWFQNGKIWTSRIEAQEAMRFRGERGRAGDFRQRQDQRPPDKLEWKPKGTSNPAERQVRHSAERGAGKLDWKPKDRKFAAEGRESPRSTKREGGLEWKPKAEGAPQRRSAPRFEKPEWKPRGTSGDRPPKRQWSPKGPRAATPRSGEKLAWRPKSQAQGEHRPEKREWIPKEEYKKAQGSKPKARDKNWRPGGEHRDPRQKYKDAKKAKWTRFKQNVRKRWETKQGKKKDEE